ncbi:MAG TPA: type II CAAX endopeptidase family protein [Terriglobales bacterium]|nr:type II CAAX endopeptidase family protein [Terriglobales bacterium]
MTPEQPYLSAPELPKPPHPFVRFLVAAILIVLANVILPLITFLIFSRHPLLADAAYRWLASGVILGGFIFFTRVFDESPDNEWKYIGLPGKRVAPTQFVAGFAISAVLITIAVASIAVLGTVSMGFDVSGRSIAHEALVVILLMGGALLEELSFRGYPFQRLVEAIRPIGAIVVFSVLFGAVHLQNPNSGGIMSLGFFNTILVGVLFAYAYLRTQTLWLPIGMHFGWNFFLGVVYGLPVSGLRDFSVVVRSAAHGSHILTGGAYGIEASLPGTLVLLLGFLLVAWAPKPELDSTSLPQHNIDPGI